MALPASFSNNTTPTGAQLDANFAAVGVLGTIPCAVAGTNTLTLTPLSGTPTLSAYANYMHFSGIAAGDNTTVVTAQVGSLPALPVYKDTVAGPVVLTGGEIQQACAFTLIYDVALGSGAGGFHLFASTDSLPIGGGTVTGDVTVTGTLAATGLATITALRLGSATSTISRINSTTASVTFTVVPANTTQQRTITLTGASVNDSISIGAPASVTTGTHFYGYVPASGTVAIVAVNPTAASLTPVSGLYRVTAIGGTP